MYNKKALNNLPKIILLLAVLTLSSCVSRVSLPEEGEPALVVDLQMLRGAQNISATVHTSINFNGNYNIEHPEDVILKVRDNTNSDAWTQFVYNEETGKYDYLQQEEIIIPTRNLFLECEILGSNIKKIKATSKVPKANKLVQVELVESHEQINPEGKKFWQGKIRFNFEDLNIYEPLYYQLLLSEKLQTKTIVNEEIEYTTVIDDESLFEIVDVTTGQVAVKELRSAEGLWIDTEKLEDDYYEVVIRSTHPIELENQTSDNLFVTVLAITKEHYDYYLGLHNKITDSESLYGEKGLYRSNIENGYGVFSTCVKTTEKYNLAE